MKATGLQLCFVTTSTVSFALLLNWNSHWNYKRKCDNPLYRGTLTFKSFFNVESSPQKRVYSTKISWMWETNLQSLKEKNFVLTNIRLKLQPMMNFFLYPREINVVAKYPLIILDGAFVPLLHLMAFQINFYF